MSKIIISYTSFSLNIGFWIYLYIIQTYPELHLDFSNISNNVTIVPNIDVKKILRIAISNSSQNIEYIHPSNDELIYDISENTTINLLFERGFNFNYEEEKSLIKIIHNNYLLKYPILKMIKLTKSEKLIKNIRKRIK